MIKLKNEIKTYKKNSEAALINDSIKKPNEN